MIVQSYTVYNDILVQKFLNVIFYHVIVLELYNARNDVHYKCNIPNSGIF